MLFPNLSSNTATNACSRTELLITSAFPHCLVSVTTVAQFWTWEQRDNYVPSTRDAVHSCSSHVFCQGSSPIQQQCKCSSCLLCGHWPTTQLVFYCFVCSKEPNPLEGLFPLLKLHIWADAWNQEELNLQLRCRITLVYYNHFSISCKTYFHSVDLTWFWCSQWKMIFPAWSF